jgi:hypothetical protein
MESRMRRNRENIRQSNVSFTNTFWPSHGKDIKICRARAVTLDFD